MFHSTLSNSPTGRWRKAYRGMDAAICRLSPVLISKNGTFRKPYVRKTAQRKEIVSSPYPKVFTYRLLRSQQPSYNTANKTAITSAGRTLATRMVLGQIRFVPTHRIRTLPTKERLLTAVSVITGAACRASKVIVP